MSTIISRYIAKKFLFAIAGIFIGCFLLVLLVDFVELFRRASDRPNTTIALIMQMSLYRVPELMEQIIPFATLFGSIAAFLGLSRKLELVILRASGMSVWQFLTPAIVVAACIGLFASLAFNPAAAYLKEQSLIIDAKIFGRSFSSEGGPTSQGWVRQKGDDGDSILRAHTSFDQGQRLGGVTVFSYDKEGNLLERIDAKTGELHPGYWKLSEAMVSSSLTEPRYYDTFLVSTHLTPQEVSENIAKPEAVPFWTLPNVINQAENSGLPAYKYRLRYQTLLARPLLLAAMVLIAATVSLKILRFGNVGKLILGGVIAGFVLYVVTEMAKDLGNTGLVNPILSAWLPAIVATLMGFTIILYQEDG